jgi:hypothetical protein
MAQRGYENRVRLELIDRAWGLNDQPALACSLLRGVVIDHAHDLKPHAAGDPVGRFHDVASPIEDDTLHSPTPQLKEFGANPLLQPTQTPEHPRVVLEPQPPLVALTVVRHPVREWSHTPIEHLDITRLDHVGQQPVHSPDRDAKSPRQSPLRNVRAALKLNDEQLTELAVRPLIDALQAPRSATFERRPAPARQFRPRTVVRRGNIVDKERDLVRVEETGFAVEGNSYTLTLSVTGRI